MPRSPSVRLRDLDIATFLARLESMGVRIDAPLSGFGFWRLTFDGPPARATLIAFGGYSARVASKQIRVTLANLGLDWEQFWTG